MMTQHCLSRGQLKEYLSGWAGVEIAEQIEAHLADCSDCEQTVVALESEPDTMLEIAQSEQPISGAAGDAVDSPIAQALRAAKLHVPSSDSPEPSSEQAAWPMLGQEVAGYELLRPLGRGGMGTVYVAKHRKLGKEVAIKLLPREAFRDPRFASRFEREMRAAGGLEHPSIVRATDAGEDGDIHYLAMELVDGLDLSRIVRLAGRLEIADACELVGQIALGLAHAHAAGVVHRDIKPSNIVVSREGIAKLLDFGLARTELWDEVSVELTTVGQLMGTIDYMAPEQAERPETVDYRADLYALGATLFRLLSGRTPLSIAPSLSPLAKLRLLAMHEPPSIDTLRDDVPGELVALISELLARSPDARPPSADHVAQRLAELGQGSDLPRLVALAIEQADSETDFELPADQRVPPQADPNQTSSKRELQTSSNHAAVGSSGRYSTWAWLLSAASVLTLAVAGVLFTLETQKGQLVIESDVPGVTVQIKQDGKVARELTIEGGAESTRLWAGKYEVVLGAGSDSVQVTDGSVSVMRGETKIARVQLVDASNADLPNQVAASVPPAATRTLLPGDTLRITSLQDPALNTRQVRVMADSTIKLPMVGTVSVEGKVLETLEVELNQRYGKYMREPAVEVFRDEPQASVSGLTAALRGRTVPPASTAPLQPGDGLTISSMQDRSIACRVIVQADHTIKPTFVGTVSVKGKTIDQLEQDLEVRYGKYVKDPGIQVFRDFTVAAPSWLPAGQGSASQPSALASAKRDDEPMYDSRTLSQWLELLRRERSSLALFGVFNALDALAGKSTSERITNAVLEILPSRVGTTVVEQERSRSTLDARAFELLRRANSGRSYCDILQQQLSSPADPSWKQRIASKALVFRGLQAKDIRDLNVWLLENVLIEGQHQDLREDVMKSYRAQAQSTQITTDVADVLISALADVTAGGHAVWLEKAQGDHHSFWLDDFPVGSITRPGGTPRKLPKAELYWNSQWAKAVARRAVAVLEDPSAQQHRRVQAERILYFLLCTDRDEEFGIDRVAIGDWVVERIEQLSDAELLQPVKMAAEFRQGYRLSDESLRLGVAQVTVETSAHSDVETLALIELAHATLIAEENQKFLGSVMSRVENHLFDMNFDAAPESFSLSFGTIRAEAEFPDFKDPRNVMPYASAERLIALMIACRIYFEGLELPARDEFVARMADAQQQRWFASKVGGERSEPKPVAVTFERAKESLSELLDSDARSNLGVDWSEICQEADKDGDSKLDAAEYVSVYNRLQSVPTAEDKPHVEWARIMIGKYDSNGDGVLTADEWGKMIVKPTKADYNKDGIITVDEYARYRKG